MPQLHYNRAAASRMQRLELKKRKRRQRRLIGLQVWRPLVTQSGCLRQRLAGGLSFRPLVPLIVMVLTLQRA